jgi:PilZ domain-containing protein
MAYTAPERRRSLRANVDAVSWLTIPATWPIQLQDLSLGGVAFTSPFPMEVGRTASVRATVGGDALSCPIRVCWTRPRHSVPGRSLFEVGAVFLPLEDSSRRALEVFLKLSPAE